MLISTLTQDSVRTFTQSVVKVDPRGNLKWGPTGTVYQIRQIDPGGFREYTVDSSGGIIITWDEYNGTTISWDIVVQQVSRNGALGEVITAVVEPVGPVLPQNYRLLQNYPNPFNPETTITFSLTKAGRVLLKLYDLKGKEVMSLVDKELQPGKHGVVWRGDDKAGQKVASGIYFYRLWVNDFQAVRKLILMR